MDLEGKQGNSEKVAEIVDRSFKRFEWNFAPTNPWGLQMADPPKNALPGRLWHPQNIIGMPTTAATPSLGPGNPLWGVGQARPREGLHMAPTGRKAFALKIDGRVV